MAEQTVIHNTFVIDRKFPQSPEKVFAAFADPAKKRRWFFEGGGHEIEEFDADFRVGGREHVRFKFQKNNTPVSGLTCVTDARYQDIVPNRRLVFAGTMTIGGKCISATLATLEFLASGTGTDLIFTHQGAFFEGADGPEMRQAGWHKLFDRLTGDLAL